MASVEDVTCVRVCRVGFAHALLFDDTMTVDEGRDVKLQKTCVNTRVLLGVKTTIQRAEKRSTASALKDYKLLEAIVDARDKHIDRSATDKNKSKLDLDIDDHDQLQQSRRKASAAKGAIHRSITIAAPTFDGVEPVSLQVLTPKLRGAPVHIKLTPDVVAYLQAATQLSTVNADSHASSSRQLPQGLTHVTGTSRKEKYLYTYRSPKTRSVVRSISPQTQTTVQFVRCAIGLLRASTVIPRVNPKTK